MGDLDVEAQVAGLREAIASTRRVPGAARGADLDRVLVRATCALVQRHHWLGQHRAAVEVSEDLLEDRAFDHDSDELAPLIASALGVRGLAYEELGQLDDAAEAFGIVDERFGEAARLEPPDRDRGVRAEVLRALIAWCSCLRIPDADPGERLAVCERVAVVAGDSTVPWMRRAVAGVLADAAAIGCRLGLLDEGLAVANEVVRRFRAEAAAERAGEGPHAETLAEAPAAGEAHRGSDAGADAGPDLDAGAGFAPPGSMVDSLNRALVDRVSILHLVGRHDDELGAWDELAGWDRRIALLQFREHLLGCLIGRARASAAEAQPDRALSLLDDLARRLGDPSPPEYGDAARIAGTLVAVGDALVVAGRRADAVLALAQVPRRFGRPWPAEAEGEPGSESEDDLRDRLELDGIVRSAQARVLALQMAPLFG